MDREQYDLLIELATAFLDPLQNLGTAELGEGLEDVFGSKIHCPQRCPCSPEGEVDHEERKLGPRQWGMANFTAILHILQTLQTLQPFFTVNHSKFFGPVAL